MMLVLVGRQGLVWKRFIVKFDRFLGFERLIQFFECLKIRTVLKKQKILSLGCMMVAGSQFKKNEKFK